MKQTRITTTLSTGLLLLACAAYGKIITVNTADNTDFGAGKTNLVRAITLLEDGDTIKFNIPGAGPHYLVTPPMVTGPGGGGGYPEITNNNVTIDGYSQPGAAPNTNPILAPNNAQLKIVLDSRAGGSHVWDISGYGTGEAGTLVISGNNVTIKGLCFLGKQGDGSDTDPSRYAISLGNRGGNDAHIAGCWIGVAPDGTTIAGFNDAVTGFRHRVPTDVLTDRAVIGVKAGSANPRAEFNVMVDLVIPIIIEGAATRISGNFIGVLPDGMTRVPNPDYTIGWEGHIELARAPYNIVIGTDGDGVNDADERNLLSGGVHSSLALSTSEATYDHIIEFYGGGTRTNIIIAGNYIGVAIDGKTFFTNACRLINGWGSTAQVQIGSDFDGVSDDIEANVIANNHPFNVFYPDPYYGLVTPPDFAGLDAGERVSLRGNVLINNHSPPYSYANNTGLKLAGLTNYYAPYMEITNEFVIPSLVATSTYPRLQGSFAVGKAPYTNIIIDVYQVDPEGWSNGRLFNLFEMTDYFSYTNGFAQGLKYAGSRTVPNTGTFDVDISGMDLGLGAVTVTVNYSADPPGTRRGRVHTSNFASPVYLLPGGVASVGLTHIVPDMICWYNVVGNYPTNGPVKVAEQLMTLGNWEPYASVLGDSTFLVEYNTYASDASSQNFQVALQPAAGGAPKRAYAFWADDNTPYAGQVNLSRQNGNPGRVAGDPRYGAVNYITEAEVSLGQIAAFQTVSRWTNNPIYSDVNRYAGAQVFALNPLTLAPTPLTKAWDFIYGRFPTVNAPFSQPEVTRTGGRVVGLDNGNFVVMNHDKTRYLVASDATTFSIIRPDGTEVKSATVAKAQDIWDNMCAYKGGFAIRCHNSLLFYDNAGSLVWSNDINVSSGLSFGTGREDASRIGGDIRSPYVYLAGKSPDSGPNPVWVAIWDSRTGNCVAKAIVTDSEPGTHIVDRVVVAVDAYNRFCVAYEVRPTPDFLTQQIAARVMQFDGSEITYLTHSFRPFVNYDPAGSLGIITARPTIAMTPQAICIAAKGTLNSTNNPAAGPDTWPETTVYTVISHPAPMPKPQPQMTVTRSGGNAIITWNADAGLFVLQSRASLTTGSWADVSPQPATVREGDLHKMTVPIGGGNQYFQLVRRW